MNQAAHYGENGNNNFHEFEMQDKNYRDRSVVAKLMKWQTICYQLILNKTIN